MKPQHHYYTSGYSSINRSTINKENDSDSITFSNCRTLEDIPRNNKKQYTDQREFLDDITTYTNVSYIEDRPHRIKKFDTRNIDDSFNETSNNMKSNSSFRTNSAHEMKKNSTSLYETKTSNSHSKINKIVDDNRISINDKTKGIPTNSEIRWLNKELNM